MFKRLKQSWARRAEDSESHLLFMGVASFLESTVVPIPLEVILIPYYHTHRAQLWRAATVVTVACLIGASLFYYVGSAFMDSHGTAIVETFSDSESFDALKTKLDENGFVLVLAAGVSPIPFQIAMLAAGAVEFAFWKFLCAAILARGLRYYGLAWLVARYGDDALRMWRENKLKAGLLALLLVAALYGIGRWIEWAVG